MMDQKPGHPEIVGDLQLGIESYQTKLNLERPNWDATDYFFKEDYTIVLKPRAVIYRDINDQRKLMRLNEIHKFSDGTLTRVMEKLDHMDKRLSSIRDTYPILLSSTHCGNKSIIRVLRIILVILPEHPSETKVLHNEDGNPTRANIKEALGSNERPHKGVKASANSDIMYFFTSAQDGDPLQDDVRLCLGDDLKKAQDHSQSQAFFFSVTLIASSSSKSSSTKGDVLEGGGVSSNVTLSDSSTFLVCLLRMM
ncbi:hypothetical protein Tco_0573036 [Tanacetum coccineum]